jgi:hypothetical protein
MNSNFIVIHKFNPFMMNDINFIKSFKSQKINRPLFEDNKQVSKSGIRINGFCQKWAYSRLNETN